jgi:DNA-binding transcriptional LysR family regulator
MDSDGIELSHLRYFVALAEELHFGRASARLHMAQPPLTRQIKLLEERLGCRLFERTSRSTRLSGAGELLLRRARVILAEAEHTFLTIQAAGRGEEGQLTVATAPSFMLGELPHVIRIYRKTYPRVAFRLLEMASSAILQAVRSGAADLGCVRGADKDPEIETHLRWRENLVAILPKDHPLAEQASLTTAQLKGEPFVWFPRDLGPSFFDELMGLCRRAGFAPVVVQEARQWSSIVSLVSAGIGVSIGPQPVTALMPKAVRYVPLRNARTMARMAGGRASGSNPAVRNFLRVARERYEGVDYR